jgi:hypothetical protein
MVHAHLFVGKKRRLGLWKFGGSCDLTPLPNSVIYRFRKFLTVSYMDVKFQPRAGNIYIYN